MRRNQRLSGSGLSAGPLKPATVHQAYRALRRTRASAVENDILVRNPLEGIKPPRVEPQEMRFLTPVEVATLADTIDERYRAFVGTLQPLKTRASRRSVALPGAVLDTVDDHLRRWAGRGHDGFVFIAPDGGHLDPDNLRSRIWAPAVAAAGVAPLRIHDLRHTTASLAVAAGADVKTLQTMLGHASAVMTLDRYGHLMPGTAEDVAARLDTLARTAEPEPIRAAVRLDAAGFSRDGG